jgi:glc operon protein GlcG
VRDRPEISHEQAMVVVDYVRGELEARGAGAAVAVTDPHGELVALLRTDGCPLASITNAIHKAFTAAREGIESAELGRRSRHEGFPMTNFGDLRYTGWGGGVPISVGGSVIGAVGVSGLPEEDDVMLARTAAATVGDRPPQ